MKIEIEDRRMVSIEVDSDKMVACFPNVWQDFLGSDADDAEARREYVSDWIHEVGLEDFLGQDFVTITDDDAELEVDVKR